MKLLKIAPHIRCCILESRLDFGSGGWTTPTTEVVCYQERWEGDSSEEFPAPHLVPSLCQAYSTLVQAAEGQGGGTIIENLERTIGEECLQPYILYPSDEDWSISQDVQEKKPFVIVVVGVNAIPLATQFSGVCVLTWCTSLTGISGQEWCWAWLATFLHLLVEWKSWEPCVRATNHLRLHQ